MRLFPKRTEKKTYDRSNQKPVIKASICNGEQVAGFKDIRTGKFEEVMLIRRAEDLETFKIMYGIEGEITINIKMKSKKRDQLLDLFFSILRQ